jgi:cytochrome P450
VENADYTPKWQTQRKNLMPAFSFRHIRDLYPSFWSKSCEFVDIITTEVLAHPEPAWVSGKSGGPPSSIVDISSWLSRATLDILGAVGLGYNFEAMSNAKSSLLVAYGKIFAPSAQTQILMAMNIFFPSWIVRNIPFKRNRELHEAAAVVRETCRNIIEERRAAMEETKSTDVDILSTLQSSGADDDGLVEHLVSILAAG